MRSIYLPPLMAIALISSSISYAMEESPLEYSKESFRKEFPHEKTLKPRPDETWEDLFKQVKQDHDYVLRSINTKKTKIDLYCAEIISFPARLYEKFPNIEILHLQGSMLRRLPNDILKLPLKELNLTNTHLEKLPKGFGSSGITKLNVYGTPSLSTDKRLIKWILNAEVNSQLVADFRQLELLREVSIQKALQDPSYHIWNRLDSSPIKARNPYKRKITLTEKEQ